MTGMNVDMGEVLGSLTWLASTYQERLFCPQLYLREKQKGASKLLEMVVDSTLPLWP